jgi:hypothetical protein
MFSTSAWERSGFLWTTQREDRPLAPSARRVRRPPGEWAVRQAIAPSARRVRRPPGECAWPKADASFGCVTPSLRSFSPLRRRLPGAATGQPPGSEPVQCRRALPPVVRTHRNCRSRPRRLRRTPRATRRCHRRPAHGGPSTTPVRTATTKHRCTRHSSGVEAVETRAGCGRASAEFSGAPER